MTHPGLFRNALEGELVRRVKSDLREQVENGNEVQITEPCFAEILKRQYSSVVQAWASLDREVLVQTDRFVDETSRALAGLCKAMVMELHAPDSIREDVAQDCAVRTVIVMVRNAVRKGRAPSEETYCLPAYVKTIARGLVADYSRATSRQDRLHESYAHAVLQRRVDPESWDRLECDDLLEGCLSSREERVVRRYFLDGANLREVAEETGVSRPMVSKIKRSALEKLRPYFFDDNVLHGKRECEVTSRPVTNGLSEEKKGQAMATDEQDSGLHSMSVRTSAKLKRLCDAFDLPESMAQFDIPVASDDLGVEKLAFARCTLTNVAQFFDDLPDLASESGGSESEPPLSECDSQILGTTSESSWSLVYELVCGRDRIGSSEAVADTDRLPLELPSKQASDLSTFVPLAIFEPTVEQPVEDPVPLDCLGRSEDLGTSSRECRNLVGRVWKWRDGFIEILRGKSELGQAREEFTLRDRGVVEECSSSIPKIDGEGAPRGISRYESFLVVGKVRGGGIRGVLETLGDEKVDLRGFAGPFLEDEEMPLRALKLELGDVERVRLCAESPNAETGRMFFQESEMTRFRSGPERSVTEKAEMLLVDSKTKAALRHKGVKASNDLIEAINAAVHKCIEKAASRAESSGRKTVRGHDFIPY